ncbi:hypothetical protein C8J57DRAFT_1532588 [Mycena rebaudengoi]|nr:hypothetical protein C8J57DRAFT_1532588 [Mycena rebaudengoi]
MGGPLHVLQWPETRASSSLHAVLHSPHITCKRTPAHRPAERALAAYVPAQDGASTPRSARCAPANACKALTCQPLDTPKVRIPLSKPSRAPGTKVRRLPATGVRRETPLALYKGLGAVLSGIVHHPLRELREVQGLAHRPRNGQDVHGRDVHRRLLPLQPSIALAASTAPDALAQHHSVRVRSPHATPPIALAAATAPDCARPRYNARLCSPPPQRPSALAAATAPDCVRSRYSARCARPTPLCRSCSPPPQRPTPEWYRSFGHVGTAFLHYLDPERGRSRVCVRRGNGTTAAQYFGGYIAFQAVARRMKLITRFVSTTY